MSISCNEGQVGIYLQNWFEILVKRFKILYNYNFNIDLNSILRLIPNFESDFSTI